MRANRSTLPIALSLLIGTGLSILAAVAIARQEATTHRLQFQRQTDTLTTSLQRSINRYTDILLALSDFYAVSEQTVSRAEFDRFVQRALISYPGIQALEWAPVVLTDSNAVAQPTNEREELPTRSEFEASVNAAAQAAGYPTFQITERASRGGLVPAKVRDIYVPVTYLQPWKGNEQAFGYDLISDNSRRMALETARDTGTVAASGRIRLVQENRDRFGFLVFLPIYAGENVPVSVADRRRRIKGYLLGVFRVSEVVEESLDTLDYDIDFSLIDETAAPDEQFLGAYEASTQKLTTSSERTDQSRRLLCSSAITSATSCSQPLSVGGRTWAIAFSPAESYPATTPWRAVSTLVIGLLLTTMVARYLAQAQAELTRTQELSQLKIRLFSMASHELRTPLSTILLSAQLLEGGSPTTDHPRVYCRIRAAAKRMNQLLSDLLTLARAESGKIEFVPETVNLKLFCQQVVEEVQFSFEMSPFIDLVIPESAPKAVYLDPQLLRSILINLLSNAVKYSGECPRVSLLVTCYPHELVFRVKDQGMGISERDQQHLHEAFYRGENVGEVKGTGLGLSVVHACLQLHGGKLTCDSQVGEGTVFTVTVPQTV